MMSCTSQTDIAQYVALNHEQVLSARTFECDGYVVVVVLTTPIFSATERDELKCSIKQSVLNELSLEDDKVIVTFDMEIYRGAFDADEQEKTELLALAKERS